MPIQFWKMPSWLLYIWSTKPPLLSFLLNRLMRYYITSNLITSIYEFLGVSVLLQLTNKTHPNLILMLRVVFSLVTLMAKRVIVFMILTVTKHLPLVMFSFMRNNFPSLNQHPKHTTLSYHILFTSLTSQTLHFHPLLISHLLCPYPPSLSVHSHHSITCILTRFWSWSCIVVLACPIIRLSDGAFLTYTSFLSPFFLSYLWLSHTHCAFATALSLVEEPHSFQRLCRIPSGMMPWALKLMHLRPLGLSLICLLRRNSLVVNGYANSNSTMMALSNSIKPV